MNAASFYNEPIKINDMNTTDKTDRILLNICRWVNDRVNENVLIAVFCVAALIAAFNA